jgi:hypothetical protein
MSKLDELKRRWQRSGTVDDEAAYLLERVRAFDLPRERLEAAGLLGHPAAAKALKLSAIEEFDPWSDRVAMGSGPARAWVALHLGEHLLAAIRAKPELFPSTAAATDLWGSAVTLGRKVLDGKFDKKSPVDRDAVTALKALFLGYVDDPREPREKMFEGALQKCFEWVLAAPAVGTLDVKAALQRATVALAALTATDEVQGLRKLRFQLVRLVSP